MEKSIREAVCVRLREVGFSLIQSRESFARSGADIVAWAGNADGELVPWAAVELEAEKSKRPEMALPELVRSRDLRGTRDHYVVADGEWFRADHDVRSLKKIDGPTAPPYGSGGVVVDEDVAASLILDQMARDANVRRAWADGVSVLGDPSSWPAAGGVMVPGCGVVPVRRDVLWQAQRKAAYESLRRMPFSDQSCPVVARAAAELAVGMHPRTVLDPFCGAGSFLWAVMDKIQGSAVQFTGIDLNHRIADIAATIKRTAPRPVAIVEGDAFTADLPTVDVVVAAPPLGMRLPSGHVLLGGSTTNDMTVAAVDLAVRHLNPGGRAVLHLGMSFTYQKAAESYRQFLASHYRIAALISLPGGAITGSAMPSVLLVIDHVTPGETFVVQLGSDWETQITPGGAALAAALAYIDDRRMAR